LDLQVDSQRGQDVWETTNSHRDFALCNAILPRTAEADPLRFDAKALHRFDDFFIEVCGAIPSSCPSTCSVLSSGASSSPDSVTPSIKVELQFHGSLLPLPQSHAFAAWLRLLYRHDWVVYSKRPLAGPEHVLRYLGAYTHRVAISNSRLVAISEGDVTFRWRDFAHGNKKRLMTLPVEEFLRRFLLHLLPPGFVRIRNFGFLANRNRATLLPLCFLPLLCVTRFTARARP
jgi:hypothetical protein